MYGLARANAQMCRTAEAEGWFRQSIVLREKLVNDKYAKLTQNYLEFSRYLMAQGRPEEAIPYMDRAVSSLERLGIEDSDPIAYADFLDEYADALRHFNRTKDSENSTKRALELRTKYPEKTARFKPEKYPARCPS